MNFSEDVNHMNQWEWMINQWEGIYEDIDLQSLEEERDMEK